MSTPADLHTPLLRPASQTQAHSQSPPGPGTVFRWFVAALIPGLVAVPQGILAVTSFMAKSTVSGGVFGAGTLICVGACTYCMYRAVSAINYRNIHPIVPAADTAAAKANVQMLRQINSRLNGMLSEKTDLEAGVDDAQLHASINRQLQMLEEMLPEMRRDLDDLRQTVATALDNRSVSSPSAAGLDSPAVDVSFEQDLLSRLDNLAARVAQTNQGSSRNSSTTASPAGRHLSRLAEYSPGFSPVPTRPTVARRVNFAPDLTIQAADVGTPT